MKVYSDKIVRKARELRRKDLSYRETGRRLNIPSSTIRKWCFDIQAGKGLSLKEIKRNEEVRKELLKEGKRFIRGLNLDRVSQEQAGLFASLLYWCEGTKYPTGARVNFANSDIRLMRTFASLLRKGFNLEERKFRVHLQIHNYHDFEELREYWSCLLSIPKTQFLKPTITKPTGTRHRNHYKGTCTLRYYDYRVLLTLIAIYEDFALMVS